MGVVGVWDLGGLGFKVAVVARLWWRTWYNRALSARRQGCIPESQGMHMNMHGAARRLWCLPPCPYVLVPSSMRPTW